MTPTFDQLDQMAKAIRARLIGRPDEWPVLDEAARMAYRLAAADAWAIGSGQSKQCAETSRPSPDGE
jgi:hypothetical protein